MDEKEIESAVERKKERMKHHGYAIEQDKIDDQTLLSLAQLFLLVKGMPKKRELISYPETIAEHSDNSYKQGFNSATDLCTAHLVKKCKGIEEIITNSHLSKMVGDRYIKKQKGADFGVTLWGTAVDKLAQAIKEYLVGSEPPIAP